MSYSSDRPQPRARPFGSPPWSPGWEPGPGLRELMAFRPLRIVLIVLAFIWWWPVGLASVLFVMWSKRMGWISGGRSCGQWKSKSGQPFWANRRGSQSTSGNRAFDEYRAETLRRLEEEQNDFVGFLDRLRYAKDKAEFDEFLAERRQRSDVQTGNAPDRPEQPPA
jgi:hypothetical protein